MPRQMIQCGHDGLAPCGVVCVHLLSGESDGWRPVTDLDTVAPRLEVENASIVFANYGQTGRNVIRPRMLNDHEELLH